MSVVVFPHSGRVPFARASGKGRKSQAGCRGNLPSEDELPSLRLRSGVEA
jgi:hypothetical protein